MDDFYWRFEAPQGSQIASEEDYRSHFPAAMEAIDRAFAHRHSTARRSEYVFEGVTRPRNPEADHAVVYRPTADRHGATSHRVTFDVFFRQSVRPIEQQEDAVTMQRAEWCEVDPSFVVWAGARWT